MLEILRRFLTAKESPKGRQTFLSCEFPRSLRGGACRTIWHLL